jgi:hypothetical protein
VTVKSYNSAVYVSGPFHYVAADHSLRRIFSHALWKLDLSLSYSAETKTFHIQRLYTVHLCTVRLLTSMFRWCNWSHRMLHYIPDGIRQDSAPTGRKNGNTKTVQRYMGLCSCNGQRPRTSGHLSRSQRTAILVHSEIRRQVTKLSVVHRSRS